MDSNLCPVCKRMLKSGFASWHYQCVFCGYQRSSFEVSISNDIDNKVLDETERESGLRSIRHDTFRKIVTVISNNGLRSGRILDVGCAHGWFMEVARPTFAAVGIEPDTDMFLHARKKGLQVLHGYFPSVLDSTEQFDCIVFNDVFEHILNPVATLCNVQLHLHDNAFLLLTLPTSDGVLYRLATLLSRFRNTSFLERLWQKGLPSPHIHYFNMSNLTTLLSGNKFQILQTGYFPSVQFNGLYKRISYTRHGSFIVNCIVYLALIIFIPLKFIFLSDIMYILARKNLYESTVDS